MTTQAPAPTHQTTTRSRLPRINRRAQFARRARRADLLVTLLWASGAAAAALYLAYGGASQMTSVAGFITGLYVVIVPILGIILGQRTDRGTWIGAVLAVAGLYPVSYTHLTLPTIYSV